MRRFGTTICLAACLVFLFSGSALAQNSIVVESKSVSQGESNVEVGVYITNDVALSALNLCFEIRSVTNGAYFTGTVPPAVFSFSTVALADGGRIGTALENADIFTDLAPLMDSPTLQYYNTPADSNECSGPTSSSWTGGAPFLTPNGSPDAFFWNGLVTVTAAWFEPGSDGSPPPGIGTPSVLLTFTTMNNNPGTFVIDTMCAAPANHTVYVDTLVAAVFPTFTLGVITILANSCPSAPVYANDPVVVTAGDNAGNTMTATDAEGDPVTFYMASGPGGVVTDDDGTGDGTADGTWSYTTSLGDVPGFSVEIEASDKGQGGCGGPLKGVGGFQVIVNCPALSLACNDENVDDGEIASILANASGGCPPYSYGSSIGAVDGQGVWTYQTGCGDVGDQSVTITVTDDQGNPANCQFNLHVENSAPQCDILNPAVLFPQNVNTQLQLQATDADNDPLTYAFVSGTGWGDENLTAGGLYSATRPNGDGAAYTINYTVDDGCGAVACSFDVIFENPCIEIVDETGASYSYVLNGRNHTVNVRAAGGSIPGGEAGGFDFLICYDASGLSFLSAAQPAFPDGPGWEYFTYRTGMFGGNCSGGCADGYIRLFSIADMNDGNVLDPVRFNVDGDILATLTFFVTSDRNFVNSCFHVGFCSYDCGDNAITDPSGNITWISRDDGGMTFGPDYWGTCIEGKEDFVREISFCGGAICIMEPPDDRGDLNLNGIANEIGDAVLYTNYFIYGSSVWNSDALLREVQIFSSDINDDGIVLTVADLIYLIRIITGDEAPFPPGTGTGSPKLSPYANSVDVFTSVENGSVTTRTSTNVDLGGALFVYRYSGVQVGTPEVVGGQNLVVEASARNGELRVLVYPDMTTGGSLAAGTHDLVRIPVTGDGSIELVESQFSDRSGALLSVNAASVRLPESYALMQNYPNPFNAGTVIAIDLKEATDWSLTVYNVAGQTVRTFSGSDAGRVNVAWDGRSSDGTSVASGMYFYRLSTDAFTATKKMVLLK